MMIGNETMILDPPTEEWDPKYCKVCEVCGEDYWAGEEPGHICPDCKGEGYSECSQCGIVIRWDDKYGERGLCDDCGEDIYE